MARRALAVLFVIVLATLVVGAAALGPSRLASFSLRGLAGTERPVFRATPPRGPRDAKVELVPGSPDSLRVPADVVRALQIQTAVARRPTQTRSLVLAGSLAIDTNRLAHVHTRFAGEVVELGMVADQISGTNGGQVPTRPIRFGDRVEKGQLLAVLWSTDLGEKKSEYVDAISRLRLEEETLTRLEGLFKEEAIPERTLREARRNVESAAIAVARVERTLQAWRLTDAEIAAIKAEAEQIRKRKAPRESEVERSWARVELRAPLAGTILEKNLVGGDIVDTQADLFKVADLGRLSVWANVYEDDLPDLLALPQPVPWTVRLKSDPTAEPLIGRIERIGDIIDPSQHTALVTGHVENPGSRMRAGQFITATVELPPPSDEVEIPATALVEDGRESIVFVQTNPEKPIYSSRRVAVTRRLRDWVYVRSKAKSPGEREARTPGGTSQPTVPLEPGERVVTAATIELKAALEKLRIEASGTHK
jgi:membrane fusion protein, heavy metal efflux system